MKIPRLLAFLVSTCLAAAVPAIAANNDPLSLLGISAGKNGASLSVPMQVVIMLTLMTLLPAAVINQQVKERAAALEKKQGFAPGRKQLRDLKDRVADELRPRAFVREKSVRAWLDLSAHRLIVDSGSPKVAENLASVLRNDLGELPAIPLETQESAGAAKGSWSPDDDLWGGYGGRVYSTAMGTLCLEVYYSYLPLYGDTAGQDKTR